VYHWGTSRAAECLGRVAPVDFRGIMQMDGYEAYPSYARSRAGEVDVAGCWADARRGFFDAQEESARLEGFILLRIRYFYALEKRLKQKRAGTALREARRLAESIPILRRLKKVLLRLQMRRQILPKSNFGKAIA